MEEKKKKKKLTLTVSSKKAHSVPHYTQTKGKTSVVIEKKPPRRWSEKKFQSKDNFNKQKPIQNPGAKRSPVDKNFNIRKMAEERATRRFKNLNEGGAEPRKNFMGKERSFALRKQNKLTLSKALDEETFDGKL